MSVVIRGKVSIKVHGLLKVSTLTTCEKLERVGTGSGTPSSNWGVLNFLFFTELLVLLALWYNDMVIRFA